jgi:transcriptional regulator with XRE-family HTH domain
MKSAELAFYRQLGDLIRDRRKERRLTQEQLAELWNLNRTTVVNIEKGRQRISVLQLVELADYLGCTSSDLLPSRSGSRVLSEDLRAKVPDERAFSFASEIAAAGRKSK